MMTCTFLAGAIGKIPDKELNQVGEQPIAQEIDNCPKCNKTLALEHGFLEGAYEGGFDEDTEVCSATCDVCGTKFRRIETTNEKGYAVAIYEKWACLIPQLNLKFLNVGPFVCRWWKVKEKPIPVAAF